MTTMNNEDSVDPTVVAEPVAWAVMVRGRVQKLVVREDVADEVACKLREQDPRADAVPLYTADQMREAIAEERALLLTDIAALREALDEAATDCELHPLYLGDSATLDDIIRAGGDAAFVTGLARGLREACGSAAEKEQPK